MFEEYYGMIHTPFTRDIPSAALYESQAMSDSLGRLAYTAARQLFAVVTLLILHFFHTKWVRQPFQAVRHPGT